LPANLSNLFSLSLSPITALSSLPQYALQVFEALLEFEHFLNFQLHRESAQVGVEQLPGHGGSAFICLAREHVVCEVREALLDVSQLPAWLVLAAAGLPSTAPLGIGRIMCPTKAT
jgi:hypothetical protein